MYVLWPPPAPPPRRPPPAARLPPASELHFVHPLWFGLRSLSVVVLFVFAVREDARATHRSGWPRAVQELLRSAMLGGAARYLDGVILLHVLLLACSAHNSSARADLDDVPAVPRESADDLASDSWAAPHRGDVRAVVQLPAHLCTGARTTQPFYLDQMCKAGWPPRVLNSSRMSQVFPSKLRSSGDGATKIHRASGLLSPTVRTTRLQTRKQWSSIHTPATSCLPLQNDWSPRRSSCIIFRTRPQAFR